MTPHAACHVLRSAPFGAAAVLVLAACTSGSTSLAGGETPSSAASSAASSAPAQPMKVIVIDGPPYQLFTVEGTTCRHLSSAPENTAADASAPEVAILDESGTVVRTATMTEPGRAVGDGRCIAYVDLPDGVPPRDSYTVRVRAVSHDTDPSRLTEMSVTVPHEVDDEGRVVAEVSPDA